VKARHLLLKMANQTATVRYLMPGPPVPTSGQAATAETLEARMWEAMDQMWKQLKFTTPVALSAYMINAGGGS
jgi:hypothetical protein